MQHNREGESVYKTKAWRRCRNAYYKSVGGLCEKCLANGNIEPGEIVHHKIHLTQTNASDPTIAYDFSNLELLCRKCHAAAHPELATQKSKRRYKVDYMGNVQVL